MSRKTVSKEPSTIYLNIIENYQNIVPDRIKNDATPELNDIYSSLDANTPTKKIYDVIDNLWESIVEFGFKYKIIHSLPGGILQKLKYELILELTSSLGPAITSEQSSIQSFLDKHSNINGVFHSKGAASPALRKWTPHAFTKPITLNHYKHVYETKYVDDLFFVNTPSQEYIHSHIKVKSTKSTKISYFLSQCDTHLTNTLLYSFNKKPNFSNNYFRYSLSWILELRENMRLLLDEEAPVYEKLLISYYSEQLLSLSYLRSGYNFVFGKDKAEISTVNLEVIKRFFYVYCLSHTISSHVLKNYYLSRFCRNNRRYFPNLNKLNPHFSNHFTISLLKVEFGVLPYLKNMFFYYLYQISQNKKLTSLRPPKATVNYTDDNCLYKLCCNYLNCQKSFLDETVLHKKDYILKKYTEEEIAASEGLSAIHLYLSRIYLLDNQLSHYINISPDKSTNYLESIYNCSKGLPTQSCLELLNPLPTPIHDGLIDEIFSSTFPFTQYYTEFLFQKNYGFSDFKNFSLNIT